MLTDRDTVVIEDCNADATHSARGAKVEELNVLLTMDKLKKIFQCYFINSSMPSSRNLQIHNYAILLSSTHIRAAFGWVFSGSLTSWRFIRTLTFKEMRSYNSLLKPPHWNTYRSFTDISLTQTKAKINAVIHLCHLSSWWSLSRSSMRKQRLHCSCRVSEYSNGTSSLNRHQKRHTGHSWRSCSTTFPHARSKTRHSFCLIKARRYVAGCRWSYRSRSSLLRLLILDRTCRFRKCWRASWSWYHLSSYIDDNVAHESAEQLPKFPYVLNGDALGS